MYLRFNSSLCLAVSLLATSSISGRAQSAPPQAAPVQSQLAPGQTAGTAIIRGRIADPSGAVIPGTDITISNAQGRTVATATSDGSGNYEVHNLPAGTYTVTATAGGFAPFVSQGIVVAAGQAKHVDVAMAIEAAQQSVTVTDDNPTVSVDADSNQTALTLKGADLDALSDDPDELSNGALRACRPIRRAQWRPDLHRRLHRRRAAAQVVHP